jgi:hypothetical protein
LDGTHRYRRFETPYNITGLDIYINGKDDWTDYWEPLRIRPMTDKERDVEGSTEDLVVEWHGLSTMRL